LIFTAKHPAQGLNLSLIFLKATDFGGCFTPQRGKQFRVTGMVSGNPKHSLLFAEANKICLLLADHKSCLNG